MSKLRAYILATITMVLGAGMGILTFYFLFDRSAHSYLTTMQTAQASSALSKLKRIRSGDTNGTIEHLESELDSALIGLAGLFYEEPTKKPDAMLQKTLIRTREYRAKYPRKIENAEVGAAITNVLNLTVDHSAK